MKRLRLLVVALLAVLLLCGCARSPKVKSAEDALEPMYDFLQALAYHEADEYECTLKDTLTQDGHTTYLFEACWNSPDGECYPLGVFRVDENGTVMIDSVPPVE